MIADAVLLGALGAASYLDAKTGYIRNWLTVPLYLSGLVHAFMTGGFPGAGQAVLCSVLAVPMAFPFALLPGGAKPGGGDVKLVMATGTWLAVNDMPLFFAGVQLARFLLEGAVRLIAYRSDLRRLAHDLKYELYTQDRAVCSPERTPFAKAAANVGYTGRLVVPGAVIILMGVIMLEAFKKVVGLP